MSRFLNKEHDYKNNVDPIENYIKIAITYMSKYLPNKSKEEIEELVRSELKKDEKIKNPKVIYRERDIEGNVGMKKTNLLSYIKYPIRHNHIIVPSFTVYFNPKVKKSLHSEFINENVAERNKHKKLAFKYDIEGDIVLYKKHNTIQKTKKIFNNSLSGAYASSGTILYNPSAHYTLTSITRCVSGTGNSLSEQVISGNRHLYKPEIVINYIATIISFMDIEKITKVINKYNLHIPTVDELMSIYIKSISKYWRSATEEQKLMDLFGRLTDLEKVWVAYLNDFYHLRIYNEELIRDFYNLNLRKPDISKIDLSKDELSKALYDNSEYLNMLHHVRADVLMGKEPIYNKLELNDLKELYGSLTYLKEAFEKYDDLLSCFLLTDLLPINIAYIRNMLRECIVLSDTDSTCATYEDWVIWYYGENRFGVDGIAATGVIMTVATTNIDHGIKVFAANMNIPRDRVNLIAMKNEFYWDVFVNTNVSKHYFADFWIKEGNVRNKPKNEIKGVNLIASTVYRKVIELKDWMMNDIFAKVRNKEMLPLKMYLTKVMEMEQYIIDKLYEGSPDVLKLEKIKEENSYKLDKYHSPYYHHLVWERVFSKKYGKAPDPMYMAIKIPVLLDNKTKVKNFLEKLEDKEMSDALGAILVEGKKDSIKMLRFPLANTMEKGLPDEIKDIIDISRTVLDNCNPLYMILESIGYYKKPDMILLETELNINIQKS